MVWNKLYPSQLKGIFNTLSTAGRSHSVISSRESIHAAILPKWGQLEFVLKYVNEHPHPSPCFKGRKTKQNKKILIMWLNIELLKTFSVQLFCKIIKYICEKKKFLADLDMNMQNIHLPFISVSTAIKWQPLNILIMDLFEGNWQCLGSDHSVMFGLSNYPVNCDTCSVLRGEWSQCRSWQLGRNGSLCVCASSKRKTLFPLSMTKSKEL